MKSRFQVQNKVAWAMAMVILAGFLYRLAYILWGKLPPVIFDATSYSALAVSLITRGKFWIGGEPFAFYTPLYSWFLAGNYWLFGMENYQAVRLVQVVLSTVNLWLLYGLVKNWLGRKTAILAVVLATIYTPFIYANSLVLTEVLYSSVLLVWLNRLYHLLHRKAGWSQWLVLGNLWGVMLLIRPISALFIPSLFIALGVSKLRRFKLLAGSIPGGKQLVIMTLGVVIVLSPWIVRNYRYFHKIIPFSAEAGNVFLLGTYKDYVWEWDAPNWPSGADAVETDSLKIRYGFKRVFDNFRNDPVGYGWWYLRKFKYFWFYPYSQSGKLLPSEQFQLTLHRLISWLSFVGLYITMRRKNKFSITSFLLLGYLTVIHMVFMTLDRLAFPTEYLLIGLASHTMILAWSVIEEPLKQVNWRKQLSLGGAVTLLLAVLLFRFITNDRFNHYSLLQYARPEYVFAATLARKIGWMLLTIYFAYRMGRVVVKSKALAVTAVLGGIVFYQISGGFMSKPKYQRLPLGDEFVYTKIIDKPDWDKGEVWKLQINFGRENVAGGDGQVIVKVNGDNYREIGVAEIGYGGWINIGEATWSEDRLRVDISTTGISRTDGLWLAAQKENNFGLSLFNGRFGQLSPEGDLESGSYEIGLSSGSGIKQVPVWYGNGRYVVRQRLLMSTDLTNGAID